MQLTRQLTRFGVVHHKAALAAYNRALLQARAEEHDEVRR